MSAAGQPPAGPSTNAPAGPALNAPAGPATTAPAGPSTKAPAALAVAASFLGSLLLFAFEPYVGKLLLPAFGGTPLLWNTCMVFFQVALLAGYLYALALVRVGSTRVQAAIHLAVIAGVLATWPSAARGLAGAADAPLATLLAWLSTHALLPFLGLASLTSLVQSWFARSGHPGASDPWRLYAASNAGSMVGLFAYPLFFEPRLDLGAQRSVFTAMLVMLVAVLAAFAASIRDGGAAAPAPTPRSGRVDWPRLVFLSAVPSSLLLSVTNYVLTDVASIPFFWTVPLALYLLTFIIAFGRRLDPLPELFGRLASLALLAVVVTLAAEANSPATVLIPLHLGVFFACCLACHVRLTTLQPDTSRLAEYYLAISVGGAVGGMATLLVPPLVTDGFVEYPVALVLAALVLAPGAAPAWSGVRRALDAATPAALLLGGSWVARSFLAGTSWGPAMPWMPAAFYTLDANTRGPVFAVRLASCLLASLLLPSPFGEAIFAERNFYGRVRVTVDSTGQFHHAVHGSTVHGIQRIDAMHECRPASYYHPSGPAGRFLASLPEAATPRRVALVGLGSGALACYARTGEHWDLYEINPAMARAASDPALFSFVTNSKAATKEIVPGDARLAMEARTGAAYDVIVVDAFSSDAIPLHLLTREALANWAAHLAPGGSMLFHISNRFFRLEHVIADSAAAAGLAARLHADLLLDDEALAEGKSASTWMLLTRPGDAAPADDRWNLVPAGPGRAWTDEYSDPLGALAWPGGGS